MNDQQTEATEATNEYLVGVRLRDTAAADDYKLVGDLVVHVGDIVIVETQSGTALGEVRRARRPVPEFRRDRLYRRVVGVASEDEAREYRDQRRREEASIATTQRLARARGLTMKVAGFVLSPLMSSWIWWMPASFGATSATFGWASFALPIGSTSIFWPGLAASGYR